MTPRPLIFISAVSRELRNARQLVANTLTFLGYQPIWQDIFGTESGDLRQLLRQQIDQCKGVVQLVGQCYGAEPPTPDEQFGRVSYTQYEALYARQRGKKVWYLFIDESFPIDAHEPEPAELRELQTAYRRRLQSDTHVFHPLTSSEALEASVLKLRGDLIRLRRGVKQWAVGVTALLALIAGLVIWQLWSQTLMKREMKSEMAKLREGIMAYPQMESQVRGSETEKDPAALQERVYAELAKQLGVDAKLLREKLPRFADELKHAPGASSYERANAAYVAKDYVEAERLALQAADEARQAAPSKPKDTLQALNLAGLAAQTHIEYARAMEHFREAEKLTNRDRDPQDWADVQYAIASLLDDEGHYSDAENLLRNVVEVRAHVLGGEHPDTLLSRNSLANALQHEGKFGEAEVEHRDVMNLRERILGARHPDTLASRSRVASDLLAEGKFAEAEAEHRNVMNLREKILGAQHPDTLGSRHNLATALYAEAKYAQAEVQFREVIKLEKQVLGPEHPDTLSSRSNLALTLLDNGKYREAEEQYREVINVYQKVLGPEHPDTLWSRSQLARALHTQGKCKEAEAEIRSVIKLQEKTLGAENAYTVGSRLILADALDCQGKYAEAEAEDRSVNELWRELLGPEYPGTLASRSSLDKTLLLEGKDAEADIREVIKLQAKVVGPEQADTLDSRNTLADALERNGRYAEAEAQYREVIRLKEKVLGPEHPSTLTSRSGLDKTLMAEGKDAEADMREVIKLREKVIGPDHPDTLESCYDLASGLRHRGKIEEAKEFARRAAEGARKVLGPDHPFTRKYEKLLQELE